MGFSPVLQAAMTASMDGKMLVWDNSTLALRATCQHSEVLPAVPCSLMLPGVTITLTQHDHRPADLTCALVMRNTSGSGGAGVSSDSANGVHRLPGRHPSSMGHPHWCVILYNVQDCSVTRMAVLMPHDGVSVSIAFLRLKTTQALASRSGQDIRRASKLWPQT